MDTLLSLKPVVTALIMPAALAPLSVLVCLIWTWKRASRARAPWVLMLLVTLSMWFLSCQAVAVWLSKCLLPPVVAVQPHDLSKQQVQAIVILGGGVESTAEEYAGPTLPPEALARLVYGVYLSQATDLPMAYSGGIGWAGPTVQVSEAEVAAMVLKRLRAPGLRWQDSLSRDTQENAWRCAELLLPQGIRRIALVTHAWHMPRSLQHFQAAGFEVTPAPMGYVHRGDLRPLMEWLPSSGGLNVSTRVLREALGIWVAQHF